MESRIIQRIFPQFSACEISGGSPRGVPLDFEALEQRRMAAIGLWKRSETQAAVARLASVVPQS